MSGWLIDEIFENFRKPAVYTDQHRDGKNEARDKNLITQLVPIDEFDILIKQKKQNVKSYLFKTSQLIKEYRNCKSNTQKQQIEQELAKLESTYQTEQS